MPTADPHHLVLASQSPRRRDLLRTVGFRLTIRPAHIDETRAPREAPADYVSRLATRKARAAAAHLPTPVEHHHRFVLAADTTVAIDDHILEKPADADHARHMLRTLSGRTHTVYTAVAALDRRSDTLRHACVQTRVTFSSLTDLAIERYIASGEPFDKAGAYGIQARGGAFVRAIDGSYSAVVGLPLAETLDLLTELGAIDAPPFRPDPGP